MSAFGWELDQVAFRTPEWLQALWLLPLVILLYLWRRRAVRWEVPHLPLWERVLAKYRRRSRWTRTLLSILLQTAILACAIVWLAGPFVPRARPGTGHTVVVLDRSLGTRALDADGVPLSERVLGRGRELVSEALSRGTVSVAFLADELIARVPTTDEPSVVAEALLDLPAPEGGRRCDRLARAAPALGDGARKAYVTPFVPSDAEVAALEDAGVLVVRAGSPVPQAGITAVTRSGTRKLAVTVAGEGPPRALRLRSGEELVARADVTPTPEGASVEIDLPAAAGPAPTLELHPADAFTPDDRAALVFPEREKVSVLVVADRPAPFLLSFLEASAVVDRARSGQTTPAEFRDHVRDYDVVILVDGDQELPLPAGRYLLLGAGAPELPVQRERGRVGPAEPVDIRQEDPLVRALDLSSWRVERVVATKARPDLDVIVRGSRGPLVSRGARPGIKLVDVAVPPDLRASTLPKLNAFPLLLEAALVELVGLTDVIRTPVFRTSGRIDLGPSEEPFLISESGSRLALGELADGTGFRLPPRPGRYRVGEGAEARRISTAILDHPGRPGAPLEGNATLAPFPEVPYRESLEGLVLLVLGGLLLLEWVSYAFLVTD